ncbi:serine/threonine-protein kinase [Kitasatospora sp. NPDC051914]|uniref:serine/threonine-protein kinase n=1 Tax=Kitasatospora sp. NPDC051914 TaxID=3154945 RepID=UPI0034172063
MTAAGDLLAGRYLLLQERGRGGFGTVFRGHDRVLDREIAVKVLNPSADDGHTVVRGRFDREARLLAGLDHPGIVGVLDRGTHGRTAFIVMEYLPGPDLQVLLREHGGPLPVAEVLRHGVRVADALDHAHTRPAPVVHRDLKPSNLMLDRRGEVRVLDFGMAVAPAAGLTRYTRLGSVLGTLLYMAPEQLVGEEADTPADLYAFGAVLHTLLTGVPPFLPTGGHADFVRAVLTRAPGPPSAPAGLAALVLAMLAKRPGDRPTAATVRDTLGGLLRQGVGEAPEITATSARLLAAAEWDVPTGAAAASAPVSAAGASGAAPAREGTAGQRHEAAWEQLELAERELASGRQAAAGHRFAALADRLAAAGEGRSPAALAARLGAVRALRGLGRREEAAQRLAALAADTAAALPEHHPLARAVRGLPPH